ncbi:MULTISPECIES: MFS transporter [unclassified Polaromonas]|uniref:MFS transporter n=1 Tax=unclassified Polaromonas TaxID=2638319 RepID=UPI000BC4EB20|nr:MULTISPECIES: MFS transporter [unclassified Polaromonas]OYY37828.1 MAG: MFS transporter [Polaromonas sp. 35-63-35]OYZ18000.1 MAG: MFS transporter [Polaromonas sp. 16-63-31]OYZ79746.1 MAG: MFS transporter [Polaromonas sp. 24-63-21]OZA50850.1 MAG: MFS transporter [Polaromonas sp. 17-63-33]OZA85212.1 MAG: MFS transporter [Polaromonas sp. 39-63-25]
MQSPSRNLSLAQVLICGAAIVTLSMGIRHGFGLWLQPITQAQGWTRETFAFALAVQNLSWGVFGIFAGMLADRFGAFRVIAGGSVLYALGLVGMALSPTGLLFTLTAGVLIGAAQAGTTYAVIYGVIGRNIPAEKRSWAMGVAAAAGSFGQFLMVPVEGFLISGLGWKEALLVLGAAVLLIAPLAFGLRETRFGPGQAPPREQTILQALKEAFKYPSFQLLMAGYFVCGFQVVFIGVHMPSYLKDKGLSPQVASYALALIGLFNVFGTYAAGALGQRLPKKNILAFIYLARAVVIAVFLAAPLSPASVYIFASLMGLLWLSTVPPTNAVVAQIFGIQHLSMLSGFVFFSHQIGSFMGVWLGGVLYDRTGSYDIVWYITIALGVFAALINLPVREAAIHRPAAGRLPQGA